MSIPANILTPLVDVLAKLYPEQSDARTMTRTAGLDETRIDFSGKANNTWTSILCEAELQESTSHLLAHAQSQYPAHQPLTAACNAYADWVAAGPLVRRPSRLQLPSVTARHTPGWVWMVVASAIVVLVVMSLLVTLNRFPQSSSRSTPALTLARPGILPVSPSAPSTAVSAMQITLTPTATLTEEPNSIIPTITFTPAAISTPAPTLTLGTTPTATSSATTGVPSFTVSRASVNVRSGPGTMYPVIGVLRANQTFPITGRDVKGSWWQFDFNGQQGWVSNSLVKVGSESLAVPVVPTPPPPTPSAVVVTTTPGVEITPNTTLEPACVSGRRSIQDTGGFGRTAEITTPQNGATGLAVGHESVQVRGTFTGKPEDATLWLLVYFPDNVYYPQSDYPEDGIPMNQIGGQWWVDAFLGPGGGSPECLDLVLIFGDADLNTFFGDLMRSWYSIGDFNGVPADTLQNLKVTEKAHITVETSE